MHGPGTFYEFDGSYFQGTFKNNNKDGPGVYFEAKSGSLKQELWMEGTLVRRSTAPEAPGPLVPMRKGSSRIVSERLEVSSEESCKQIVSCRELD
jgi:hypothetical protein